MSNWSLIGVRSSSRFSFPILPHLPLSKLFPYLPPLFAVNYWNATMLLMLFTFLWYAIAVFCVLWYISSLGKKNVSNFVGHKCCEEPSSVIVMWDRYPDIVWAELECKKSLPRQPRVTESIRHLWGWQLCAPSKLQTLSATSRSQPGRALCLAFTSAQVLQSHVSKGSF